MALWMSVIYRFSALPGTDVPGKYGALAHFLEYAVLGALLWFAFDTGSHGFSVIAVAVIAASAYGVSDEFHQFFVPGRVPDIADWGVDTIGALVGAIVAASLMRKSAP